MKSDILAYAILAMVFVSMGSFSIISSVRTNELVSSGEEIEFYVKLKNPTGQRLSDLSTRALFVDDGGYIASTDLDLGRNEHRIARLFYDTPRGMPADDYLVRITVQGDDAEDSKYMYVRVI